jgi:hypothetical protein
MPTEPLREHLQWHLRRLKSARAAAAELSLRAETDGLQWLSLTHFAILALEATLAEDVAPDHKALEEVIADLTATRPVVVSEPADEAKPLAPPPESWSTALASLSALAFPWRPPPRPATGEPHDPLASGDAAPPR